MELVKQIPNWNHKITLRWSLLTVLMLLLRLVRNKQQQCTNHSTIQHIKPIKWEKIQQQLLQRKKKKIYLSFPLFWLISLVLDVKKNTNSWCIPAFFAYKLIGWFSIFFLTMIKYSELKLGRKNHRKQLFKREQKQ